MKIECCDVENKFRKELKPCNPKTKDKANKNILNKNIINKNEPNIINGPNIFSNKEIEIGQSTKIESHPNLYLINSPYDNNLGINIKNESTKRKLEDIGSSNGNTDEKKRGTNLAFDSNTINQPNNVNINNYRMNNIPIQRIHGNIQNGEVNNSNEMYLPYNIDNENNNNNVYIPNNVNNIHNHNNNIVIYNINNYYISNKNDPNFLSLLKSKNIQFTPKEDDDSSFDKKKEGLNLEINKMKNEIALLRRQIGNVKRQNKNNSEDEKSTVYFQSYNRIFGNRAVPLDYLSHFSVKKDTSYSFLVFDKNLPDTGYNPSSTKILEVSDLCARSYGYDPPKMLNKYVSTFSSKMTKEEQEQYSKNLLEVCKEKVNYIKIIGFSKHQDGFLVCSECSCTILCDQNMKPHLVSTFIEKVYIVEDQKKESHKIIFVSL
eukprot:TRINITY_DN15588_c0_g1_i1.p1 TRINITY_DN15588_c0_g1~~TRINITY_DN15588_c0_g1_i1.p1  ORF type:complete len:467 (-),score=109.35 TRINITY_DN15588_c0_g1_i1:33-1328(-)